MTTCMVGAADGGRVDALVVIECVGFFFTSVPIWCKTELLVHFSYPMNLFVCGARRFLFS